MPDKAADISPQVTWGTNPGQVAPVTEKVPNPATLGDETEQKSAARALEYMDLKAGITCRPSHRQAIKQEGEVLVRDIEQTSG